MSECPVCGAQVGLNASTVRGELLDCGDCGSELEVRSLNPAILAEVPQEAEDWGQ